MKFELDIILKNELYWYDFIFYIEYVYFIVENIAAKRV